MKAVQANMMTFLNVKQQFQIPIYQRTYSWTDVDCRQLWSDIVRVARDESTPTHFIGSIVYISPDAAAVLATAVPHRLVIDGQQRLTTVTILLCALRDALAEADAGSATTVVADQVHEEFLLNKYAQGEDIFKLLLTDKDRATLLRLVERQELDAPSETLAANVVASYKLFGEQMTPAALQRAGLTLDDVFTGLKKLMIVEVSLEHGLDDPQLIFESLNSTGRDLSQADLIRNFVLMRLTTDAQNQLYRSQWQPMEKAFLHTANGQTRDYYADWFDGYVRDYLTMKNGVIPRQGDVYDEFKKYARRTNTPDVETIVADLHHYAQHYVRLGLKGREPNAELHDLIHDINELNVDVAYPFLMRVLEDYVSARLSHAQFRDVLRLIESYVFRRSICGIPTHTLNRTFAGMYATELREARDGEAYLAALVEQMVSYDGSRRFPRDEEFRHELKVRAVYNMNTCDYLLRKLENWQRPEKIQLPSPKVTIEHILPQTENLRPEWRADLGPEWQEDQGAWVHTLGNLTLTGYNSSFSDRPFPEKRDLVIADEPVGLGHSPFRLNQGLHDLEAWNAETIQTRAKRLSLRAAKVWPFPPLG